MASMETRAHTLIEPQPLAKKKRKALRDQDQRVARKGFGKKTEAPRTLRTAKRRTKDESLDILNQKGDPKLRKEPNPSRGPFGSKTIEANGQPNIDNQDELGKVEILAKIIKATRIKFDENGLDLNPQPKELDSATTSNMESIVNQKDNVESEDEGPETITVAAGLDQARAVAAGAVLVEKRQQAVIKKRRKELDARLKLQATSSRKRSNIKNRQESSVSPLDARTSPRDDLLPALLPDEILAVKPNVQVPKLLLTGANGSTRRKPNPLMAKSKRLKDIKRGAVRFRVLETDDGSLPPKSSQSSKRIREAWLLGRPGRFGIPYTPRRKIGSGFVRK